MIEVPENGKRGLGTRNKGLLISFLAVAFVLVSALIVVEVFYNGDIAPIVNLFSPSEEESVALDANQTPPTEGAQAAQEAQGDEQEGEGEDEDSETVTASEELSDEEDEAEGEVEEELVAFKFEPGPESNDKVWEALERVATWKKAADGYPARTLMQYLAHRKLWVRLAAFEFAVEAGALSKSQLAEAGRLIRAQFNGGQIARFLQRSRARDLNLHNTLRGYLGV